MDVFHKKLTRRGRVKACLNHCSVNSITITESILTFKLLVILKSIMSFLRTLIETQIMNSDFINVEDVMA